MTQLLRFKPELLPCRQSGSVRVGGTITGIAADLQDPDGSWWALISALNGNRTVAEVIDAVTTAHPRLSAEDVMKAIGDLDIAGYLEDLGAPLPLDITPRDQLRYARQVRYHALLDRQPRRSPWDTIAALRCARVTIIGLGATGAATAMLLTASGIGTIHGVDPDVVELSNLSRQVLYDQPAVGRPKAAAAKRALAARNYDTRITTERTLITNGMQVRELAKGCDVLVLAADDPLEIRNWANRACIAAGRPWVHAGYCGAVALAAAYAPGTGTGCCECAYDAWAERPGQLEADQAPLLAATAAPPAAMSAGIAATLVMGLLAGIPPVIPGSLRAHNLLRPEASYTRYIPRRPGCPACGS